MQNNYNRLPEELRRNGRFCLWRYENIKGRLSKIPYTRKGVRAKSTDKGCFCDFWEAFAAIKKYDGMGMGIFDGYCAVDIDNCVKDGKLSGLASDVIETMDSYTEISPSGKGVRIIFKADGFKYDKDRFYINNRELGLEIYVSGCTNKYVTLTGRVIRDLPVARRSDKLPLVLDKYMRKPSQSSREKTARPAAALSDEEVIKMAMSAKNSGKFRALWNGDILGKSHSEADLALCSILAFWCGGDSAQTDRIFRKSALYRKKWERPDYRGATLKKAVDGCNEVYSNTGRKPAEEGASSGLKALIMRLKPDRDPNYPMTDIGAGRLFADCFKDTARYVPERKCWYCFDGGVWKQDVGGLRAMERMKELSGALMEYALTIKSESKRIDYINFCARWQKRCNRDVFLRDAQGVYPIAMQEFDRDPYVFNCQNGTLHLDTMEFTEHRASDRLTKLSSVVYDPGAKCPRFDYFVGEICEGDADKERFLQKAMGYALSGDTRHECMFILYGATTRNGKGTLCESVLGVMGDYGCTSRPETISSDLRRSSNAPSEDIARLAGVRFVNISEPGKGLTLDAAKLKSMTGNDSLNARFLNENSFDFKPSFKLYINTNYLPVVNDMTLFSSGRIITVPFERHFDEDEQDKTLKSEFSKPENKSAILNWLIEGYRFQADEGLDLPFAVQKATESYQDDSDKIRSFASDCLVADPGCEERTAEVYQRYQNWCRDNGYHPEGMRTFKQGLLTFAEVKKKRPIGGGNVTTMLIGYKLISDFL